ncbi:hypothetical protein FH972_025111 [Carpinus fangiana]|uniref:Protein SDA1 n=1 Tax=Carpinus fangiana TaxID=176857 RepID=A0A5N6L0M0_9ROSI|nr:hypothetical protein FH972_025111 [Carpinus fangiana]
MLICENCAICLTLEDNADRRSPNLQHKINRDPPSYAEDFKAQYQQYDSFRQLVMQAPASAPSDNIVSLRDLIDFISHVANNYPALTADFPQQLIDLLAQHHEALEHELREKVVGALVILRKKDVIDSPTLLNALFPLLTATSSKSLRSLLYQKILSDIRTSNSKATNHKLNRTLQTVLYNLLSSDRSSPKGIWAVRITRELWRRQVWTDAKAVEIMKEAALSDSIKVIAGGVNFFLGGDKEREDLAEADSSDDDAIDMRAMKHQYGINKKNNKAQKQLRHAALMVKKKERKKGKPHPLNFSALHLLHDPQGFAESLFQKHLQGNKSKLGLEQKLQVLQLVSRLVGLHKLTIITLYSYFLKFLTPKQASVTSFLASLAQSTHDLVPPDAIEPVVQKIANEFVSEAAAGQVAAAGLNAIREICTRQPLAMSDTLLQDLVMYRKSKDKSVMMAAKGLLSLYRDVGPDLLKKRDRGKEAAMQLRTGEREKARFGEQQVGTIEGLELLEAWKEQERRRKREEAGLDPDAPDREGEKEEEEEEGWKNWDAQEDDSDDSGGWINVESDGEDINISDSEDEKPSAKKQKKEDEKPAAKTTEEAKTIDELNRLATTRILTPADLTKLNELRQSAAVEALLPGERRRKAIEQKRHADDGLTAADLEGVSNLGAKMTKEERVALSKGDRENEDHRGGTAKRKERKEAAGKSTTNKDKARKKNMMMTIGKARGKQKRSLRDIGRTLKGHVDRQKRGGRRGNN